MHVEPLESPPPEEPVELSSMRVEEVQMPNVNKTKSIELVQESLHAKYKEESEEDTIEDELIERSKMMVSEHLSAKSFKNRSRSRQS